jgi:hypothetical protein
MEEAIGAVVRRARFKIASEPDCCKPMWMWQRLLAAADHEL